MQVYISTYKVRLGSNTNVDAETGTGFRIKEAIIDE